MKNLYRLIILSVVFLTGGCATFAEQQEGKVTSTPSGADVYYSLVYKHGDPVGEKKKWGTTPFDGTLKVALFHAYMIAEKNGYESEIVAIPKSGNFSHHFNLERDYGLKIRDERSIFPNDFVKSVIGIIGTYEQALNSSRMLSASVAARGRSELQNLMLDFPKYTDSALIYSLKNVSRKAKYVTGLPSAYYNSDEERSGVRETTKWINKVKFGLGVSTDF